MKVYFLILKFGLVLNTISLGQDSIELIFDSINEFSNMEPFEQDSLSNNFRSDKVIIHKNELLTKLLGNKRAEYHKYSTLDIAILSREYLAGFEIDYWFRFDSIDTLEDKVLIKMRSIRTRDSWVEDFDESQIELQLTYGIKGNRFVLIDKIINPLNSSESSEFEE